MMRKRYFTNIIGELNLWIEYVFIEYERPILFLCKEENTEEEYLCLCYECRKIQKWLIAKTDEELIYKMVEGAFSVRDAFLKGRNWILVEYDGTVDKSRGISLGELLADSEILPDDDVYLDEDERDDYFAFLSSLPSGEKRPVQKIVYDSTKMIEGLSDTMREILKRQYYNYDIKTRIINEILIESSEKSHVESFGNIYEQDIVTGRTDVLLNATLSEGKNILEIDGVFSGAA